MNLHMQMHLFECLYVYIIYVHAYIDVLVYEDEAHIAVVSRLTAMMLAHLPRVTMAIH